MPVDIGDTYLSHASPLRAAYHVDLGLVAVYQYVAQLRSDQAVLGPPGQAHRGLVGETHHAFAADHQQPVALGLEEIPQPRLVRSQ